VIGIDGGSVICQRTIKRPINCTGIGLHSGARVAMTLAPAEPDTGIRFVRTDLADAEVPAQWDRVVDTRMCTMIGEDGVSVGTVEHLLAALAGVGIDNLVVRLDGPEVPIMDGSAAPFVFLVECAGIAEQARPRRAIRVLKPVSVRGDRWSASLEPADGFSLDLEIDFDSSVIARQAMDVSLVNGTFKKELSRARTFGFLNEVEALRAAGLARGGSLDNAVVVNGDQVLNEDGLRYDDEFVRHKLLDAVGDLYLAGGPIVGRFQGVCSGHAGNNALLHALFADEDAWAWDVLRAADLVAYSAHHRWAAEGGRAVAGG